MPVGPLFACRGISQAAPERGRRMRVYGMGPRQNSMEGSHRAICGNAASRKTRNIMARKKGTTLRKMLAMGTSVATLLRAKTLMPTGGVICPASMFVDKAALLDMGRRVHAWLASLDPADRARISISRRPEDLQARYLDMGLPVLA